MGIPSFFLFRKIASYRQICYTLQNKPNKSGKEGHA